MITFLLFTLACSGTKDSESTETSTSETTETTTIPDVNPVILSVDSGQCSPFGDSDPPDESWNFLLTVDDPQGNDTIRTGNCDATKDDAVLVSLAVACRNGTCTGSSRSSVDGLTCDFDGSFVFVVHDTDGNASTPFEYTP